MDLPYTEPPADPVAPAENRHITLLAFRRRFTKAERAGIEWAAVDKPDRSDAERQQSAALRSDLEDQKQASHIDLNDPDLIDGVETLELAGLIGPGRAAEILTAAVQPSEAA